MPRRFRSRNQWRREKRRNNNIEKTERLIVNLSDEELDAPTLTLLSKGLSFCPTPLPDHESKVLTDLLVFERRCRLRLHFLYNLDPYHDENKYRAPSAWTPISGRSTGLDGYLKNIIEGILHSPNYKCKNNLNMEEKAAMKKLCQNDKLEIKPADKGGCIVIMNRVDYENECLHQLKNKEHYARTGIDLTTTVATTVTNYLQLCKKHCTIPDKIVDHLIPKSPRTALFYTLPKIHKAGNPGHPIISANECPTEKISQYVDFYIRPLAKQVTSYIKDTNDFLTFLHDLGQLSQDSILCTIDVSALYTSIPHEEGIKAVKTALSKRTVQEPPTSVLTHLVRLILTNNVFRFNKTHYRQIQGTAMGTKMAPSYAILFMADLEEKLLEYEPGPRIWKRYVDDIIIIYEHGEEELVKFLAHLNQAHETIKFTAEYSKTTINFLDVQITKNDKGYLSTDLYIKPTDSHAYLNFSSCHPRHIVNSIPYSQAIRIQRICSEETQLKSRLSDLKSNLVERGFPTRLVQRSIDLALDKNRPPKAKKHTTAIPLIMTYDPRKKELNKIITTNEATLQTDSMGSHFHKEFHSMVTYRRPRNLKDILVHSDFVRNPIQKPGMRTCPKKCTSCPKVAVCDSFTSYSTNKTYKIQGSHNCQSSFIIYLIQCSRCHVQYVGQTSNSLHQRLTSHTSDVKKNKPTSIAAHFNQPHHSIRDLQCLVICPTYRDANLRLRHEEAWIRILETWYPTGLNIKE